MSVCNICSYLLIAFALFPHFASRPRQQVTQWPHRACPPDGKRERTQREELTMSTTTTAPPHGQGQSCRYIGSAGQHDTMKSNFRLSCTTCFFVFPESMIGCGISSLCSFFYLVIWYYFLTSKTIVKKKKEAFNLNPSIISKVLFSLTADWRRSQHLCSSVRRSFAYGTCIHPLLLFQCLQQPPPWAPSPTTS